MKTSELSRAALDWAVAKCEQQEFRVISGLLFVPGGYNYNPSTDWAYGGRIIERERLGLEYRPEGSSEDWYAVDTTRDVWGSGATPLVAAMRCYVASKLGDEIEIPEELL